MISKNAFIAGIKLISSESESPAAESSEEGSRIVTVNFEGARTGLLDLSYPRASVWSKMISYLQKNNRPVYVETDPDTLIITKLFIPKATRVLELYQSTEEVVNVALQTSEAGYYLRRNLPDFQNFLDILQSSKDTDSEILVTSTHHDFEIVDVRPLPPSFGNNEPKEPPPPLFPDPPVSPERATEIFNMMKTESCSPCSSVSPCIPYRYPRDGCWIRAHLMCYLMIDEGETPEKIWITGSNFLSLLALSSNVPECQVKWNWHVAPTLMVTQTSGPDIKMVIDPSLCEGPITTGNWQALQNDPGALLTTSSWDAYQYLASGTASRSQADNAMEEYRLLLDELCADYGPSPYACPITENIFFIVDRSTISKDEIDAMLFTGNPAIIETAFYVVVDGFVPWDHGIRPNTLVGVPNIMPALTITPEVSQMTIEVMPNLKLEDPVHLIRRQRMTWKYKISFTGTNGFMSELQEINLSASIFAKSANAKLYLIKQPNPYEIDGETAWLSTDLRVFQIKAGESKFAKTMGNDAPDFIASVIQNLNNGNTGGQTFETISIDQQTSRLELSQTVGGIPVFNFAIAKVRYRALSVSAQDVRVFFRLFPASSTSLEYSQTTTYRRAAQGGVVISLPGIIGGEIVTIPCFAAPRVDSSVVALTSQTDPANVQQISSNASGSEVVRYFGCWLDINQTQLQFPVNPVPVNGPYTAASRYSIQQLIRNQHQCLVSEIAFDPAPIPNGTSPSLSDKLAQRNLAIVESANPGDIASHRIPHTFEIKPTPIKLGPDELNDELMIDWGNIPLGCRATLYLPGVDTIEILKLAVKMYRSNNFVRIDSHTLQCETGGITYIPVPQGEGANYAGMMSVDLPETIKKGQVFTIVVRQVTNSLKGTGSLAHGHGDAPPASQRRILGTFQITIPVRMKEEMLVGEERLLSNLRWIQKAIPENNRWFPVFNRYVKQIASRVNALGGDSEKVPASPSDNWKEKGKLCKALPLIIIVLLGAFIVITGSTTGGLLTSAGSLLILLLIFLIYYWINHCKPDRCLLLKTILIGVGSGAVVLTFLVLLVIHTPQGLMVLGTSILAAGIAALMSFLKRCF